MSKYKPFETYLQDLPPETRDFTLSFAQIERIINDRLPRSASLYTAWWNNDREGTHVQAYSWLNAGWLVESVNFSAKWIRVRRI